VWSKKKVFFITASPTLKQNQKNSGDEEKTSEDHPEANGDPIDNPVANVIRLFTVVSYDFS
jgi:hypothetical protein